jgi:hypothetical protein
MAGSKRPIRDALDGAGDDAKTVAKAGPAGVLLVTMIILAVVAIIVLGLMLLGSRG